MSTWWRVSGKAGGLTVWGEPYVWLPLAEFLLRGEAEEWLRRRRKRCYIPGSDYQYKLDAFDKTVSKE